MPEIDEIVRRYILLGLSLGQHEKHLVDTYYGPEELVQRLPTDEPVDLETLLNEAGDLIDLLSSAEDIEDERKEFLLAQLKAIDTTIRIQFGEELSVEEKVDKIYGIEAFRVNEREFEEAHRKLNALLPGDGSVAEKWQAYADGLKIPDENLEELCVLVLDELRKRTWNRFGLADDETVELRLVRDKFYGGHCHYEGNGKSILEINMDRPFYLDDLTNFLAHEVYPGHHTEFCTKDVKLVQKHAHNELWLSLMLSPQLFVSEMIATHARSVVLSDDEHEDWLRNILLPKSGLDGGQIGRLTEIEKASRSLWPVNTNAVFMHWSDGADETDLIEYFRNYSLTNEEEAKGQARFAMDPIGHIYLFSYHAAYEALDEVFSRSDDISKVFSRLLSEQLLPSTIRSW